MDPVTFHKESIRAHAAKRFKERYGQELTPKIRSGFFRQIERGHNCWLVAITHDRKYGGSCEIYFVIDRSVTTEPIVVIFRPDWMEIVTFMTPEFWRNQVTGDYAEERRHRQRIERAQHAARAADLRKREEQTAS